MLICLHSPADSEPLIDGAVNESLPDPAPVIHLSDLDVSVNVGGIVVHQTPALPKEENGNEEEEGGDEKKDNEEEDPLLEVISIYNNMDERTQLLGPHYTHRDTLFYHKLNFACLTHKTFNLLPHHAVWET
ncbi:hypothetical protein J6590_069143 [Homalodisca vitripennis]|nr:hypothetical protein J6590_069143 [Homalodisca vitripennis]